MSPLVRAIGVQIIAGLLIALAGGALERHGPMAPITPVMLLSGACMQIAAAVRLIAAGKELEARERWIGPLEMAALAGAISAASFL